MLTFDDDAQNKKLDDVHKQEEEELVQIMAEGRYGLPYINLSNQAIENEALRVVPEENARELEVAPFKLLGKNVYIALRSPAHSGLDELKEKLLEKGFSITFFMASLTSLSKVWDRYKELSKATVSGSGLDISGEVIKEIGKDIKTISDVQSIVEETNKENKAHKVSHILEIILGAAISLDVSDVHFEPEENNVRLRFRLDGVLQEVLVLDNITHKLLNSRLKLIAGMKITTQSMAQDGRFSIFMDDLEINIRTSVIPGAYGESIVMRILNPKSIQKKLEEMGIPKKLLEIINNQIAKPNGLILITGPTGSGKTTTLYGFLRTIYSPEIKIITIEDPIEYHLPGITQTQVEDEKGYTFLEGLRSALRQDPDVIMVGEIRDDETAKIAVESALTGHIVFSTLHTNNAGGVIPRLIDLGVSPKLLPSALSLSMAQRLVRKLCVECKKEKSVIDPRDEKQIREILEHAISVGKSIAEYNIDPKGPFKLYDAVGCDKCNNTGYNGRAGIYEAILSTEEIEKIITNFPSERDIKIAAESQGILFMREDGIIKALQGITSIEEVRSVVDLEEI